MSTETVAKNQTSPWYLILTLVLAGFLLFFAFRGVDWHEMLTTLQQGQLNYLALACIIQSSTLFIRGLRWRILLSAKQWIAPFTLFWVTSVGYLSNSFLPARAGEVIRSVMIGRSANISKTYALATTLTERILDVVTLVLAGSIALMTLENMPYWLLAAVQIMAGIGFVGLLGLFVIPKLENILKKMLSKFPLPKRWYVRIIDILENILLGMRSFQHLGRATSFVSVTALLLVLDVFMSMIIAQALNLNLSFSQTLLLLAALGLSSAVPSTPGYVGIYQFVAVTVLMPFGFSQSAALAYIIMFQAVSYIAIIVWGFLGLYYLSVKNK